MLPIPRKFHKLKRIIQDIPTRSEIQQHLGASMAQIFFDYNHPEVAKLLDSLSLQRLHSCTMQDDQLKTCGIQSWPEEQEILKSRIHQDILALGESALKKFQTEIDATAQNVFRDKFEEKCHMLEAENRFAVKRNVEEIHARYEEYFEFAQRELEEKLRVEWANVSTKHSKELQKAIVKARMDTTHDVLKRMRPEICHVVASLYKDFELSYRVQREIIIADFNEIMRKQHIKLDMRIKEVERKKMEELHIQRHELEIQNATNIIYVLCMERLRNNARMHAVHEYFEKRIKSLQELIVEQAETMNMMKEKIAEYRGKNIILQEKIIALTKEFQKFINLAFDAAPEHADFLLSLDLLINGMNKENDEQEKSNK